MTGPRFLTLAVASVVFLVGTWIVSTRGIEAVPLPAPPAVECSTPGVALSSAEREVPVLQGQVQALTSEVTALTDALTKRPEVAAPAPPAQAQPERVMTPLPVVNAPIAVTIPEPVEPPSLASTSSTDVVDDLDAIAQSAEAGSERRTERSAALSSLSRVEEELASGDTDGARAALTEAAGAFSGERAAELRAATQSLDNEDLATARRLIQVALQSR